MAEVVMTRSSEGASTPRRAIFRHAWWWFFLIALVPVVVVAAPGSIGRVAQVNVDGFAVLAALLVAWATDTEAKVPGRIGARIAVFVVASAALLAVAGWLGGDLFSLWLALPTSLFIAFALSAAYSPTVALRDLVRPLLRLGGSAVAWAVALLAWPLLGAVGIAVSRIGAPTNVQGEWVFPASVFVWAVVTALPAAIGWYGFAARRLLLRTSALNTALLVGLLPWLAVVLPLSAWSTPLSTFVLRTSLDSLALAVVTVWVFQRSRGVLLPVLVLLIETSVVSHAVFVWSAPQIYPSGRPDLIVAGLHCAFALVLILQGRMWRRPMAMPQTRSGAEGRGRSA
jgi:hypothetical protein